MTRWLIRRCPQYFLAKEAVKHVKVALTGEGADELFGGYTIYHEPESLRAFKYTRPINSALNHLARLIPEGVKGRSFLMREPPHWKIGVGNAFIFNETEKHAFFKIMTTSTHFRQLRNLSMKNLKHMIPSPKCSSLICTRG